MARKFEQIQHDDSWITNLQDIITKPTHHMKLFADVRKQNTTIKIEYDDGLSVETIQDAHSDTFRAKAFHESFFTFVKELRRGINLKVTTTNCGYLFDEILTDHRPNARRARDLLKSKNITLIIDKKQTKKDGN